MNTVTVLNYVSKLTHFGPSVLKGSTSKRQPPKAITLDFIECHTALLQENVSDMLNDNGTKHVTHHHCIWENKKQLKIFHED